MKNTKETQKAFDVIREFINTNAPENQSRYEWREVALNDYTLQILGASRGDGYVRVEQYGVVIANEHPVYGSFDADAAADVLDNIAHARHLAEVMRQRASVRGVDDGSAEIPLSALGHAATW